MTRRHLFALCIAPFWKPRPKISQRTQELLTIIRATHEMALIRAGLWSIEEVREQRKYFLKRQEKVVIEMCRKFEECPPFWKRS